jgi:hypothetical protein
MLCVQDLEPCSPYLQAGTQNAGPSLCYAQWTMLLGHLSTLMVLLFSSCGTH